MNMAAISYVLPAEEVAQLVSARGLRSAAELLPHLASSAKPLAGCLISGFEVGAAALGESGAVYLGTNVEFPGHQLQQSIHAEQFVVANAHAHGERGLVRLCVNVPPCGHCRQFLQELPNAGALQFEICTPAVVLPLAELLPHSFGPADLGLAPEVRMLRSTPFMLLESGSGGGAAESDPTQLAALRAAQRSFAPYSKSPAGVAAEVRGDTGDECAVAVYSGSYLESAAYNPSLPPLQALLVAFVAARGCTVEEARSALRRDLVRVVLAEAGGAAASHAAATRALVATLSPTAEFEVMSCSLPP